MTTYDEVEQLKDFNLDDESGLKEIGDAVEVWIEDSTTNKVTCQ